MSRLSVSDSSKMEMLFEMKTGYVMDFSNVSMQRFIMNSIGLDIYGDPGYEEYCSKANKLRQIIDTEPGYRVGKLLNDLLDHYEAMTMGKGEYLDNIEGRVIERLRAAALSLEGQQPSLILPESPTKEETWTVLSDEIHRAFVRNEPELVLDRLHTFTSKYLRTLCEARDIGVTDTKGDYYPLHSLAGMLKRHYNASDYQLSEFSKEAIQNSIILFDRFNAIRNDASYAHDNPVLEKAEAEFVIRAVANVITFMEKVAQDEKRFSTEQTDTVDYDELPF